MLRNRYQTTVKAGRATHARSGQPACTHQVPGLDGTVAEGRSAGVPTTPRRPTGATPPRRLATAHVVVLKSAQLIPFNGFGPATDPPGDRARPGRHTRSPRLPAQADYLTAAETIYQEQYEQRMVRATDGSSQEALGLIGSTRNTLFGLVARQLEQAGTRRPAPAALVPLATAPPVPCPGMPLPARGYNAVIFIIQTDTVLLAPWM